MPFDFNSQSENPNFSVKVGDLYTHDGQKVSPEIQRGVYREDTGQLISTCGRNFKPVQHMDVLSPVFDFLDERGFDIEVRNSASGNALYDLAGKKGAFVSTKLSDNGAVMRTDIITGDFIRPTGASAYLDKGPDTMLQKYTLLNSHNGSYAVRATTGWYRLVCMNGIVRPNFSASAYGKHTTNFSVEALKAQIQSAAAAMADDPETFGLYARTKLSPQKARTFLQKTLAKLPNKPDGTPHFSEQLVDTILDQFRKEDQTVWGLMQAMTWWSTHGALKANANVLTARTGREERVATALRTKNWADLYEAA
jgi:hypothetical protein